MHIALTVVSLLLMLPSSAYAQEPQLAKCDQAEDRAGNFIYLGQPCGGGNGHCKVSGKSLTCQTDPATKDETKTLNEFGKGPQPVETNPPQSPTMMVAPYETPTTNFDFQYFQPAEMTPSAPNIYPSSIDTSHILQSYYGQNFTDLPGGGSSIFETPAHVPYTGDLEFGRASVLQVNLQDIAIPGTILDTAPFSPSGATGFVPDALSLDPTPAQTFFSSTLSAFEKGFESLLDLGERFADRLTGDVTDSANWFKLEPVETPLIDSLFAQLEGTPGQLPRDLVIDFANESGFPDQQPKLPMRLWPTDYTPSYLGGEVSYDELPSAQLERQIAAAREDLLDPNAPGTLQEKMNTLADLEQQYTRVLQAKQFPFDPGNTADVEFKTQKNAATAFLTEAGELEEVAKSLDPGSSEYKELMSQAAELRAQAEEVGAVVTGGVGDLSGRSNLGGPTDETSLLKKFGDRLWDGTLGPILGPSNDPLDPVEANALPPIAKTVEELNESLAKGTGGPSDVELVNCVTSGTCKSYDIFETPEWMKKAGTAITEQFKKFGSNLWDGTLGPIMGDPSPFAGQTTPLPEEPLNPGKFAQPNLPTSVPTDVATAPTPPSEPAVTPPPAPSVPPPAAPPAPVPTPTKLPTPAPLPPAAPPTPTPTPIPTPPAAPAPAATPPAPPAPAPTPPAALPVAPPASTPSQSPGGGSPSPSGGGGFNPSSLLSLLGPLLQLMNMASQPDASTQPPPVDTPAVTPTPVAASTTTDATPETVAPKQYVDSAVIDPNFGKPAVTESLIAKITPLADTLYTVTRPAPDLTLVTSLLRQSLDMISSILRSLSK